MKVISSRDNLCGVEECADNILQVVLCICLWSVYAYLKQKGLERVILYPSKIFTTYRKSETHFYELLRHFLFERSLLAWISIYFCSCLSKTRYSLYVHMCKHAYVLPIFSLSFHCSLSSVLVWIILLQDYEIGRCFPVFQAIFQLPTDMQPCKGSRRALL